MALGKSTQDKTDVQVKLKKVEEVVEAKPAKKVEPAKKTESTKEKVAPREATWTEIMNAKRGLKPNGEKFK